jgi:hypothetical protein
VVEVEVVNGPGVPTDRTTSAVLINERLLDLLMTPSDRVSAALDALPTITAIVPAAVVTERRLSMH